MLGFKSLAVRLLKYGTLTHHQMLGLSSGETFMQQFLLVVVVVVTCCTDGTFNAEGEVGYSLSRLQLFVSAPCWRHLLSSAFQAR